MVYVYSGFNALSKQTSSNNHLMNQRNNFNILHVVKISVTLYPERI
jgi:hypothetical protein